MYKTENEELLNQTNLLKAEIKNLKVKNSDLLCFSGRISNYSEFVYKLNIVLENYKPKKSGKEYDEAFTNVKNHISIGYENYATTNNIIQTALEDNKSRNPNSKDKKSFLGGLFGKKP